MEAPPPEAAAEGADQPKEESKEESDWEVLRAAGNAAFGEEKFEDAISFYSRALRYGIGDPEEEAKLCSNRAAAYASLCRSYRSRPAGRSEYSALLGLEPSHLARLSLIDAERAARLRPGWAKACSRKGLALFLLERYAEAEAAYLEGLAIDPASTALQEGLAEVAAVLKASDLPAKRQRTLTAECGADLECPLCARLLFEPVTTSCGHSFCRACCTRALDHSNKCPICRTVLHASGPDLPLTLTLAAVIERSFPKEYEERRQEDAEERAAARSATGAGAGAEAGAGPGGAPQVTLPLFVMSVLLPGETMSLNIFEPRYRLLVRRAMEGNRRIGMAQIGANREVEEIFTEGEIRECQPMPDGRYHIEVVGRRRMRAVQLWELDGYRVARAEPVFDAKPEPGTPQAESLPGLAQAVGASTAEVVARLRALSASSARGAGVRQLLDRLGPRPALDNTSGGGAPGLQRSSSSMRRSGSGDGQPAQQPAGPCLEERLGFWVAALLVSFAPDVSDRMPVLKMTCPHERLTWLQGHLTRLMPAAAGGPAGGGGGPCCVM